MDQQPNKKPNLFSLGILSAFFIMLFLSVAFTGSNKIKTRNTKAAMGPTTVNLVMSGADLKTSPASYQISIAINRASNTLPIGTGRISFTYPTDNFDVPVIQYVSPFSQSGAGGSGTNTATGEVTTVADWPKDASTGNLQAQTATTMLVAQLNFPVKSGKKAEGTFKFTGAEIVGDSSGMPTTITVENHDSFIVGTTGGGTDPTPTATGTPEVITPTLSAGNTTINLKLKFQGVVKKPSVNSMRVKLSVVQGLAKFDGTGDFVADDSGIWSGSVKINIPVTGTVTSMPGLSILVKGPKHMQKKICEASPTESYAGTYGCGQGNITMTPAGANTFDFTKLTMLVGDLPEQDGIINSYDFSLIRNNLNTKDVKIISIADVNYDGKVDSQDASLVLAALSVRQDEQ